MFKTRRNQLRNVVVAATVLALSTGELIAQEDDPEPATNLELIQKLSREVADSLRTYVRPGDSVSVVVRPMETAWYVSGVIVQAMTDGGRIVTQSVSAPFEIEVGLLSAQVMYANTRRKAFFGSRILDRIVSVEFNAKVVDKRTGTILFNDNIIKSVADIVNVSDVDKLENAGIPATRGVLPSEGFFSTILEPLVAMGAVAVAVYLLFHVRS
ncbi:MAG: hypothetical protein HW412_192 [Bacteroidetes bacterium]|nr:hypothetical protein [Bacteroidota bacterium]